MQTYGSLSARVIIHCAFGGDTQGTSCDLIWHTTVSNIAGILGCIGDTLASKLTSTSYGIGKGVEKTLRLSLGFEMDGDCLCARNHCN